MDFLEAKFVRKRTSTKGARLKRVPLESIYSSAFLKSEPFPKFSEKPPTKGARLKRSFEIISIKGARLKRVLTHVSKLIFRFFADSKKRLQNCTFLATRSNKDTKLLTSPYFFVNCFFPPNLFLSFAVTLPPASVFEYTHNSASQTRHFLSTFKHPLNFPSFS